MPIVMLDRLEAHHYVDSIIRNGNLVARTDQKLQILPAIFSGSADNCQGLKLLRGLGAVKSVYSPGDRRDHFAADLELSKFAAVFIKEELRPRVERALERIQYMESLLAEMPADERHATRQRLARLRHWLEKGEKMLPWAPQVPREVSAFILRGPAAAVRLCGLIF